VLDDLETDGSPYVAASRGGWIEFGEEDLPILAHTARVMTAEVRWRLDATLSALGR
jgi:hypothetical protein